MPQATTLRLVRGNDDRTPVRDSAYALLLQQHVANTGRLTTLANAVATDAEILIEALRYFTLPPARRKAAG